MTDNEIIKFIEHAINSAKSEDGFKEIYWKNLDYILDLINRQKAIIEKSEKVEHFFDKTIETANAEIERLKSDNDILSKNMHNLCKELDAEKQKNF